MNEAELALAVSVLMHVALNKLARHQPANTNAGIVLACFVFLFVFRERHCSERRLSGAGIILSGKLLMRLLA